MKLKSKLIAAAIALVAATGANAAIDNGSTGNGELFFNIWDATGSYTRDLNISISSFESQIAAGGAIDLTFAADSLLTSFFAGTSGAGARSGTLNFNVFANDAAGAGTGARRMFNTFTEPTMSPTITSTAARTGNTNSTTFINSVNGAIGANQSLAVLNTNSAAAGKTFKDKASGALNFSNAGGIANNSYASGRSFMSVNAHSTDSSLSTYNQLFDGSSEIHVYLDGANALHIQALAEVPAIPEPSEYALMLAGLGMLGFMARRRLNNRV
jgi:hypothetical protein